MKKNKLIELLNNIKGNPDIYLWNGMVGEFVDIGEILPNYLVKMRWEYYLNCCKMEYIKDKKMTFEEYESFQFSDEEIARFKIHYKNDQPWESNPFVDLDDVKKKRYHVKNIYGIDSKRAGKTFFDRQGKIEY